MNDLKNEEPYHFIQADICDGDAVLEVLEEYGVDAVMNFAAESHVDWSVDSSETTVQTNVVATLRLLEVFKALTIFKQMIVRRWFVFFMFPLMRYMDHLSWKILLFEKVTERRQGLKIPYLEEITMYNGCISTDEFKKRYWMRNCRYMTFFVNERFDNRCSWMKWGSFWYISSNRSIIKLRSLILGTTLDFHLIIYKHLHNDSF